jgi:hypothetical protein
MVGSLNTADMPEPPPARGTAAKAWNKADRTHPDSRARTMLATDATAARFLPS